MYQQITIVGNVGREPELRYTQSGSAVCDFSVAVTERWNKDGEQQQKVTWFRVSCWNKLAETVNQYLQKGRQVLVIGTIDASAWTAKDGEARASLELNAREVKFLGKRDEYTEGQDKRKVDDEPDTGDIPF